MLNFPRTLSLQRQRQQTLRDVQAGPNAGYEVVQGGSVPGYIMQTPGGVGRNIADCLARLCRYVATWAILHG